MNKSKCTVIYTKLGPLFTSLLALLAVETTSNSVLFKNSISWFLVPGSWFLVPGFWFLVSGFWFLVSGSWFLVSGFWFLVPGSWFLVPGFWLSLGLRVLLVFIFDYRCKSSWVVDEIFTYGKRLRSLHDREFLLETIRVILQSSLEHGSSGVQFIQIFIFL